jgi:hypothetical protein
MLSLMVLSIFVFILFRLMISKSMAFELLRLVLNAFQVSIQNMLLGIQLGLGRLSSRRLQASADLEVLSFLCY